MDKKALFKIGYGLYVVTTNDGKRDNGCIVNTVMQLTDKPLRVAVSVNKANYTYLNVQKTGILNVNCLSQSAPFGVFERFGFQSGRTVDKFASGEETKNRTGNGLIFLSEYINAYMSLKVMQEVDLGSHGMFICEVTEAEVISDAETMTYTFYQNNVKPKPKSEEKKGFVCRICGYVYEGDVLPDDIVCPICKHGAADFEPVKPTNDTEEERVMEMKFYRCARCGQIVAIVRETGVPVICCGEPMKELVPGTTDAAVEKHVPVYEVKGNKVYVTVGSVEHPMQPEHYIEWISVQTKFGNQRKELRPGDEPKVCFALCEGDEVKAVYAYCNLHSLWKG